MPPETSQAAPPTGLFAGAGRNVVALDITSLLAAMRSALVLAHGEREERHAG